MEPGTIRINKKDYKYIFNHRARRLFMEKYGLEYFTQYTDKLKLTNPHPKYGIGVKGLQIFGDLVITAIQSATPKFKDFDSDELVDFLMKNPGTMAELGNSFRKSQEQDDQDDQQLDPSGSRGKSKAAM